MAMSLLLQVDRPFNDFKLTIGVGRSITIDCLQEQWTNFRKFIGSIDDRKTIDHTFNIIVSLIKIQ